MMCSPAIEPFTTRVPAVASSIKPIRHAVLRLLDAFTPSRELRDNVALAVSEACSNVVLHAYVDQQADGTLEVSVHQAGADLVVTVSDDGRGMVPRLDSPGLGMGLPLLTSVCDGVEFLHHTDRPGLAVVMRFALA